MDVSLAQSIAGLSLPLAALVTILLPMLLALGLGVVIHAIFTPQELAANASVGYVKFGFQLKFMRLLLRLRWLAPGIFIRIRVISYKERRMRFI